MKQIQKCGICNKAMLTILSFITHTHMTIEKIQYNRITLYQCPKCRICHSEITAL